MDVYIICFDLISPNQNYDKVSKAINELGSNTEILNTTYIVISNMSSEEIMNYLKISIDPNDKLFVARLQDDFASTEPEPKEALILTLKKLFNAKI